MFFRSPGGVFTVLIDTVAGDVDGRTVDLGVVLVAVARQAVTVLVAIVDQGLLGDLLAGGDVVAETAVVVTVGTGGAVTGRQGAGDGQPPTTAAATEATRASRPRGLVRWQCGPFTILMVTGVARWNGVEWFACGPSEKGRKCLIWTLVGSLVRRVARNVTRPMRRPARSRTRPIESRSGSCGTADDPLIAWGFHTLSPIRALAGG
jgi:hypothetical protein